MGFKYNKVLIFGYGKSGKSVEELCIFHRIDYLIYDDLKRLSGSNFIVKITRKTLKGIDLVVLSPGISIFDKRLKLIKSMGIKVISEIEMAYYFCPYKIIAVTGTDGKTTTVNMLKHVLSAMGKKVAMLGNVGTPFSSIYQYDDLDYVIVEVSSFMLETTDLFTPYIGVILNIDEDHLDRHKTLDNYINCKLSMLKNSTSREYAVLNRADDNIVSHMDKIYANIIWFNDKNSLYIDNNTIYDGTKCIADNITDYVPNSVFYDDILAMLGVIKALKLNLHKALYALQGFSIPSSRAQVVGTKDGVTYINDSKATNFHACRCLINATAGDIVLIMSGVSKNLDIAHFIDGLPPRVRHIVLIGRRVKYIARILKRANRSYSYFRSLEEGVVHSSKVAKMGDSVLFSPCFASFDAFASYEERGQKFCEIVKTRILK